MREVTSSPYPTPYSGVAGRRGSDNPNKCLARERQIRQLTSALCQRHQMTCEELSQCEEVVALLHMDREANRRWSRRVDWLLKLSGWLGKWLPFHDLELLGQMDFNSLAQLCYYNVKHFIFSHNHSGMAPEYTDLLHQLQEIRAQIPVQTEPYRQQPCTAETALHRAFFCLEQLSPHRRVLFLGDDDLTSVALALLARHHDQEVEITVVDVDTALLAAIEAVIRPLGTLIQTRCIDLFDPPQGQLDNFDLVLADPSYDERWVRQFARVALDALTMGGHYLLSLPHPIGRDWLPAWVNEIEYEAPLQLMACYEAFNEYPMLPTRKTWIGPLMRWVFPVAPALLEQYQALPFTYSDLFVFQKTTDKRPPGTTPPLPTLRD